MALTPKVDTYFETLAKNAAKGDRQSFQQMYDAIAGKMYSLCLRYAGNREDANDCFQEGFVKLYRNLSSFRGEGSFEGWARRVFVSACINALQKKTPVPDSLTEDLERAGDDLSGYDRLTNEDLIKVIRQLPDNYRTVVNLHLVEGYNHMEIGGFLGISEEGSRSLLFRARNLLQKKLSEADE